ncbi:MAG: ribonuclease BN [Pirellula sp.]|nr:ribonuclease BN [Pirellula sp.]
MISGKNAWSLVQQTAAEWNEDKVPRLGAALAFYTALSLAPLLVFTLQIAAIFFGDEAARGELVHQMHGLVGDDGAAAIQGMIAERKNEDGTAVTLLGIATLLFGASGVFGQIQDSMNTIWEVRAKPGGGLLGMIRDRFLSFTMVLGIAFLLLVSLLISASLTALGTILHVLPEAWHWLGQAAEFVVSMMIITILFALMFKLLPDVKIGWNDVWLGASLTAALFMVGKFLIGLYLGHSALASSYGVAGSFVVLLVWVYYAAQIFFFGAEFTQVYANRYGSRITPTENAEPVPELERAQQGMARSAT